MNNRFDLNYLRKYVNGELSPAEMHAIEKASHQDELLMDVITGLEEEHQLGRPADLRDLHSAIYQRTHPPVKKWFSPYRILAGAATILVILMAGAVWLVYQQRNMLNKNEAYLTRKRAEKVDTTQNSTDLSLSSRNLPDESSLIASTPDSRKSKTAVKNQTVPVEEKPAEKDQEKVIEEIVRNSPGTFLKRQGPLLNAPGETPEEESSPNPRLTAAQIDHSTVIHIDRRKASPQLQTAADEPEPAAIQSSHDLTNLARGVVLDLQSGRPIVNATVRDIETNKVVTTDSTGQYVMPAGSDQQQLDILSIGYQTARITANNNKIVHLKPDFQSLEEVVIDNRSKAARIKSVPLIGWDAYKKYVYDAAADEFQEKGKVTLRFDISSFGRPIDIQIKKTTNPALNQAAVGIVERGPDWKKGNDGKLIEVKVDFK